MKPKSSPAYKQQQFIDRQFNFTSSRIAGLTQIELLAVIAVIAVLFAILIPVASSIRDSAHASKCTSNLRQIGVLVSLYINENNGDYPTWNTAVGGWSWDNFSLRVEPDGTVIGGILPRMAGYYAGGGITQDQYRQPNADHIFNCPSNRNARANGYAYNMEMGTFNAPIKAINLLNPGRVILVADNSMDLGDTRRWFNGSTWSSVFGFHRHNGTANVLYADLSVGSVREEEVEPENIIP